MKNKQNPPPISCLSSTYEFSCLISSCKNTNSKSNLVHCWPTAIQFRPIQNIFAIFSFICSKQSVTLCPHYKNKLRELENMSAPCVSERADVTHPQRSLRESDVLECVSLAHFLGRFWEFGNNLSRNLFLEEHRRTTSERLRWVRGLGSVGFRAH